MSIAWGVALATMVPFLCLALLLFLDRLEETLKQSSQRPALKPIPARASVPMESGSQRAA